MKRLKSLAVINLIRGVIFCWLIRVSAFTGGTKVNKWMILLSSFFFSSWQWTEVYAVFKGNDVESIQLFKLKSGKFRRQEIYSLSLHQLLLFFFLFQLSLKGTVFMKIFFLKRMNEHQFKIAKKRETGIDRVEIKYFKQCGAIGPTLALNSPPTYLDVVNWYRLLLRPKSVQQNQFFQCQNNNDPTSVSTLARIRPILNFQC